MTKLHRRQLLALAGAGTGAALASGPVAAQVAAQGAAQAAPRGAGGARLRVVAPRVDGLHQPLGLESRAPRFSWSLAAGTTRGAVQGAYRVTVAASLAALRDGPLSWDSGKVASNASFDIAYGGPPLASAQRCWWRVQAWDGAGRPATPSPAVWWEMGLIETADWTAGWLEAEDAGARQARLEGVHWMWGATDDAAPRKFRWRFDLAQAPVRAQLTVSAKDSLNGLWLDGVSVIEPGERTAWGQGPTFELPALAAGSHLIALEAGLRLDEARPVIGGAVAAVLRLTHADGSTTRLHAKDGWTTTLDAPQGWRAADFDDTAWPAARPARITPPCHPWVTGPAILLRRGFRLDKPVARARLYATALGGYEARINGAKVGDAVLAPESTDFRSRALYQTHDVTDLVRPGDNALGAIVADGWFASPFGFLDLRYVFGPPPRRFCAILDVAYDDGSRTRLETGPDGWRIAPSAISMSEIYDGETYDARRETPGWDLAGFDDSGWSPARLGQSPPCALGAQVAPPIRAVQTLEPSRITTPAPGVQIVDFGQNFAGWCRLKVTGPAGATVTLRFAEALHADGRLNVASNRRALQTDRYVLRGDLGGETFEPRFTFHGFRYVEVTGYPGPLPAGALEGVVLHSDLCLTGAVRCSDPTIQALWRNTLWSQRGNFLGVPTDCPQRDERMGWTGDAQIFWDAAAFNMDVDAFTRRFCGDIRAGQSASGEMPDTAPFWALGQNTPGWADAAVILPWTCWRRYGDTAIIDENWAAMDRWIGRLLALNPDHLWKNGRGMDYGDWLSVDAKSRADVTTPKELVATAYWAHSTSLLADMARASGREAHARRLDALRAAIGQAFLAAFVRPDGGVGNDSQTSHVLALRFGLLPPSLRGASAARLAADIQRRGTKLSTGFIGTPYILDALADHGHADLAYGLLLQTSLPSWGYQVGQGATTVFERWDGLKDGVVTGSLNHYAFGAVSGFIYRRVVGIDAAAPGFSRIAIAPLIDPRVASASGDYDSVVGRISCGWRTQGDGLRLDVTIPANATARIALPAGRQARLREGSRALSGRGDVRLVERTDTLATIEVGSGAYSFSARR